MKYCLNCEKNVIPKRRFGGFDLFLTLITGGLYLIIFFVKSKICPSCNGHNFTSVNKGAELKMSNRRNDND
jgi:hypothetical protein